MSTEILVGVALIAFAAAACQSVTAFGFSLVAVPLLTLIWDVRPAVVTSTLLSTTFMLPLLYEARSRLEPRTIAPLLVGSLAGVPVGVLFLARIDGTLLQVAVALTVLFASVTLIWSPRWAAASRHPVMPLLAGGLSGALRAATSMSGPPVVLYALSRFAEDVERFRANVLAVLFPGSLLAIAGIAIAGLIDGDIATACLVALPAMLGGTLLGPRLRNRASPASFRRIVLSVLIGAAAVMLVTMAFG